MGLSESLNARAIRELGEAVCPACENPKKPGVSFCWDCYRALPNDLRLALGHTMSDDYATAYDEAKEWLRVNR